MSQKYIILELKEQYMSKKTEDIDSLTLFNFKSKPTVKSKRLTQKQKMFRTTILITLIFGIIFGGLFGWVSSISDSSSMIETIIIFAIAFSPVAFSFLIYAGWISNYNKTKILTITPGIIVSMIIVVISLIIFGVYQQIKYTQTSQLEGSSIYIITAIGAICAIIITPSVDLLLAKKYSRKDIFPLYGMSILSCILFFVIMYIGIIVWLTISVILHPSSFSNIIS